jgi:hypothetical protein
MAETQTSDSTDPEKKIPGNSEETDLDEQDSGSEETEESKTDEETEEKDESATDTETTETEEQTTKADWESDENPYKKRYADSTRGAQQLQERINTIEQTVGKLKETGTLTEKQEDEIDKIIKDPKAFGPDAEKWVKVAERLVQRSIAPFQEQQVQQAQSTQRSIEDTFYGKHPDLKADPEKFDEFKKMINRIKPMNSANPLDGYDKDLELSYALVYEADDTQAIEERAANRAKAKEAIENRAKFGSQGKGTPARKTKYTTEQVKVMRDAGLSDEEIFN